MQLLALTLVLAPAACRHPSTPPPAPPPPRIGVTGASPELAAALERFGAVVVEVAPGVGAPDAVLSGLSGLVLGPGADLDPALYGQPADPTVVLVPADRQAQDLALARVALARDLPLLGVCLGAQEIAVALGGSLVQDIPSRIGPAVAHRGVHPIEVVPGTPLAGWYEGEPVLVVSNHHQAVDRVPEGLTVAARAPDGVIEAVVVQGRRWAVGLQYHPELDALDPADPDDGHGAQDAMWRSLVEAARRTR